MWHTDQAPLLPLSREEGTEAAAAACPLPFFSHLPTGQRGGTYCQKRGKGRHHSQLICYRKVPGIGPWLLLPPSNPPKIKAGIETGMGDGGWGLGSGVCPRKAAGGDCLQGQAIPRGLLRFCKIYSLLLAGCPEQPRVDSDITENPGPPFATICAEVEEVWQCSHGQLASLGRTQTRTLGSPDSDPEATQKGSLGGQGLWQRRGRQKSGGSGLCRAGAVLGRTDFALSSSQALTVAIEVRSRRTSPRKNQK